MADITARDRMLAEPLALKEEGSPAWCWQTLEGLRWAYRQLDSDWAYVEELRGRLRTHRAWLKVPPDAAPFGDEDTMLRETVGVDGAGLDAEATAAKEREKALTPTTTRGGDRRSEGFQGADGTLKPKRGSNSRAYSIRRLKAYDLDNDSDFAPRVIEGELSADAAMVEAGLRPRRPQLAALRRAWAKATADERAAFRAEIEVG